MLEDLLYTKKALGQDGRSITTYKFKTMYDGAEAQLDEVISANGFDGLGKPKNDPRITPIGRILRKYWIDEIPQLYSLTIGDLFLIGVRPRSNEDWKYYTEAHRKRCLKYKPGLISVNYADMSLSNGHTGLKDIEDHESRYLDEKEINPLLTDVKYLLKCLYNVVFNGVRSR